MDRRGYETGRVMADAAFTSDFAIPDDIGMRHLVDMVEIERRSMDVRPGIRHKYAPLRFDPATGAPNGGEAHLCRPGPAAGDDPPGPGRGRGRPGSCEEAGQALHDQVDGPGHDAEHEEAANQDADESHRWSS